MSLSLDDVLTRLGGLSSEVRQKTVDDAMAATQHMRWLPNPGPQTVGFNCDADQVFFGGTVAGGKTDLIIGRALERQKRSLILRRISKEVPFLIERTEAIIGTRAGYNGQLNRWRLPGNQVIQFGGCQNPGDEAGYKGERKDFVGIDEACEFLESQVDFLSGWIGTDVIGQPCQLLLGSNPPRTASGRWLLRWFAPWLDQRHPRYPHPDAAILWCMPIPGTDPVQFEWRDEPWTIIIDKKPIRALSRTFIRSELKDNPNYAATGYGERIGNMSEMNRRLYQLGDFTAGLEDHHDQLIPTAWVLAANERWGAGGGRLEQMTAMSIDPAGGGRDDAVVASRHGGWFAQIVTANGPETADGSSMAALVTRHRRNNCTVIVDVGGGYASGIILRFKDNDIEHRKFNGANSSTRRTKDRSLGFANKRAEAWWYMREELDPDQEGGSVIALPPDPELLADLTAPRYEVRTKGIIIESKEDIKERLGRSPGRGDAVVMCLSDDRAMRIRTSVDAVSAQEQGIRPPGDGRPKVVMGRMSARRAR